MDDDERAPRSSPPVGPSTPSPRSSSTSSPNPSESTRSSATRTSSSADESTARFAVKRKTLSRTTYQRRKQQRLRGNDSEDSDFNENIPNQDQPQGPNMHGAGAVDNVQLPLTAGIAEVEVFGGNNSPDVQEEMASDADNSSEESGESDSDGDSSVSSIQSSSSSCDMNSSSSEGTRANDSSLTITSECSEMTEDNLYEGAALTAKEGLLKVLKLYVDRGWTKNSLDQNIKLIKQLLPQPNEMPPNGRAALKTLQHLAPISLCEEEFVYCNKCLQLVEEESDLCKHEEAGHSKFYCLPIGEQIKHMFQENDLASKIDFYREHTSQVPPGLICDIVNGSEYRIVKVSLPGQYDIVLLWNSDGLALSSSSNQEMWLLLCTLCEVPPWLRASFLLVAGVYVGKKAPDMNVFLKPFSASLTRLYEKGVQWVHPVTKTIHVSKIAAPVVCADAPAKAKILNCKNHNARYGCVICEQKSQKTQLPVVQAPTNPNNQKKKKRVRRFLFQDDVEPAAVRTGPRMDLQGELAKLRGKSRKGVLGGSVISDIPQLDRASCIAAEYMHLILLGVVKYFLLRIFTKPGAWFLGNRVNEINDFIMNKIKVPDFINRLPRKVTDLKYFKASELRTFLLFYSLPIFKEFGFPEDFYEHWMLLVGAVHILLQPTISELDLRSAEIMMRAFVRDVGKLYGEKCYTYNVHNLLHVCLLVRRWGPLWATSAFVFETFNGFVSAHIHGTKHLAKELVKNIKIFQSVAVLENIVKKSRDANALLQMPQQAEVLGKPWQNQLRDDEKTVVDSSGLGFHTLHIRVKVLSKIFTSKIYDTNKKRANSFIQFNVPDKTKSQFGQIIVFLKAQNGTLHCLVNVFKIPQVNLLFHQQSRYIIKNVRPIKTSQNLVVIPFSSVEDKVLKIGNYIGIRPNTYEVNL